MLSRMSPSPPAPAPARLHAGRGDDHRRGGRHPGGDRGPDVHGHVAQGQGRVEGPAVLPGFPDPHGAVPAGARRVPGSLGEDRIHPATPGVRRRSIFPMPNEWTELRLRPGGSTDVYCGYTWVTGLANDSGNVGSIVGVDAGGLRVHRFRHQLVLPAREVQPRRHRRLQLLLHREHRAARSARSVRATGTAPAAERRRRRRAHRAANAAAGTATRAR